MGRGGNMALTTEGKGGGIIPTCFGDCHFYDITGKLPVKNDGGWVAGMEFSVWLCTSVVLPHASLAPPPSGPTLSPPPQQFGFRAEAAPPPSLPPL